jgi:S-methylmethionine-dependent homocysteine/selenocysteine methylase
MTKQITLLDGGMGQELVRRSGVAPTPLWSTRVMLDAPELVEALHIDFLKAGAKVITLNNYTATPARLERDASVDLFALIHAAAKEIALSAKEKAGENDVQIAGCLPPIVASYKPDLAPDAAACLAQYRELVAIQEDAVELFFCETMSTIREAVASVTAAREAGFKTVVSFTLDDENPLQLRSGELLTDAVKAVAPLGVKAVTVNCSMPETLTAAMPTLAGTFGRVGGYANGFQSVAPLNAGGTTSGLKARTDLTPKAYAAYAREWVAAGATIIGGCCEVGPDHIRELATDFKNAGFDIVGI